MLLLDLTVIILFPALLLWFCCKGVSLGSHRTDAINKVSQKSWEIVITSFHNNLSTCLRLCISAHNFSSS